MRQTRADVVRPVTAGVELQFLFLVFYNFY